jgi:hypothetical protein
MKEMDSLIEVGTQRIAEAQAVDDGNKALDHYITKYKLRYGVEPIITNIGIARTALKDITRKVGLEKTLQLIDAFLASDGDNGWYARTAHSIKTLSSKIDEVQLLLARQTKRSVPKGWDPVVIFDSGCPKANCSNGVTITCKVSEMGKLAYSVPCDEHRGMNG